MKIMKTIKNKDREYLVWKINSMYKSKIKQKMIVLRKNHHYIKEKLKANIIVQKFILSKNLLPKNCKKLKTN
jgi:choline kinase